MIFAVQPTELTWGWHSQFAVEFVFDFGLFRLRNTSAEWKRKKNVTKFQSKRETIEQSENSNGLLKFTSVFYHAVDTGEIAWLNIFSVIKEIG